MCDDPRVEKSAAMPAFGSPRRRNASLMNFAIRTTRLLYLSSSISSDELEGRVSSLPRLACEKNYAKELCKKKIAAVRMTFARNIVVYLQPATS